MVDFHHYVLGRRDSVFIKCTSETKWQAPFPSICFYKNSPTERSGRISARTHHHLRRKRERVFIKTHRFGVKLHAPMPSACFYKNSFNFVCSTFRACCNFSRVGSLRLGQFSLFVTDAHFNRSVSHTAAWHASTTIFHLFIFRGNQPQSIIQQFSVELLIINIKLLFLSLLLLKLL